MLKFNPHNLFTFTLAILLTLGLSISLQSILAAWISPTLDPPLGNTDAPLTQGYTDEAKLGGLVLNGNFLVGSDDLKVNSVTHKAGIGTSTSNNIFDIYSTAKSAIGFSGQSGPRYKWTIGMDVANGGRFSIASSTALGTLDRLVINGNGNVGIGNTSPTNKLDVAGKIQATGDVCSNSGANCLNSITSGSGTLNYGQLGSLAYYPAAGFVATGSVATALFWDRTNGRLGIGTNAPTKTLEVSGGPIKATGGLIMETRSGSDPSSPEDGRMWLRTDVTGGSPLWSLNGSNIYTTNTSHNVGIGTNAPGAKLEVAGNIKALGSSVFAQGDNSTLNYAAAPIQLREAQFGATAGYLPPRLSFHWGGVVASQLAIESDGTIAVRDNPGTGYEKFKAGSITSYGDIINTSESASYVPVRLRTWGLHSPAGDIYLEYGVGRNFYITPDNWTQSGTVNINGSINANATMGIGVAAPAILDRRLSATYADDGIVGNYAFTAEFINNDNSSFGGAVRAQYNGTSASGWAGYFSSTNGSALNATGRSSFTNYTGGWDAISASTAYSTSAYAVRGSSNGFWGALGRGDGYSFVGGNGSLWNSGEIQSNMSTGAGVGQFRAVYGSYGTIFRQDGANFLILTTNAGDPYGAWNTTRPLIINNASGYVTFASGHGDLAENYMMYGKVLRSSLVSIDSSRSSSAKSAGLDSRSLLGVVSTLPGAVMDTDGGFHIGLETKAEYKNEKAPVALAGNVPALVSSQNGNISISDPVGISSMPGFGAKAISPGTIVGKAFEKFEPNDIICQKAASLESIDWPEDDGKNTKKPCFKLMDGIYVGKIMVAVNVSWFDPETDLQTIDSANKNDINSKYIKLQHENESIKKEISDLKDQMAEIKKYLKK
jgi:hypothetical protein